MITRLTRSPGLVVPVLILSLLPAAARAEMRTWTDRGGNAVEAELIAAYHDTAYFIHKKGAPFRAPITIFQKDDAQAIIDWVNATEAGRREWVTMGTSDSPITKFLRDRLVVPKEKRFEKLEVADKREPEFYIFYDGAKWCGPCHRFSPKLSTWYRANKSIYDNFEIVFLSSDEGQGDMLEYMKEKEMPWPALRFRDVGSKILANYGGRFIPRLVVTDRKGRVLLHSELGPENDQGADATLSVLSRMLDASNRHLALSGALSARYDENKGANE